MIREDLVASAVNLLQQPQVAAAPLEKRIAFLQSKNLSTEEINAALQRVGEPAVAPSAVAPYAPPLRLLARSIRAVDISHRGSLLRGRIPLTLRLSRHRPPTPPQLAQDKAAIDASFAEAFALLDQLSTDTAALKAAEEERTKRVDTCLEEVESVIEQLKATAKRREEEGKRVGEEVRSLRDLIPKALEGQKEAQAQALQDLQNELKSLKALVVNRTAAATAAAAGSMGPRQVYPGSGLPNGTPPLDPGASSSSAGIGGGTILGTGGMRKEGSPLPFGLPTGKPSIPSWQLKAAAPSSSADSGDAAGSS
ncbi:peroxisomal membrane anchor protein conserved region-domain-containing protein [Kalaharituber pfeilii]|nr:peroxisomal membrane anchor protein conserved region-domain-containing protein [Kalaharituber pfeilii]